MKNPLIEVRGLYKAFPGGTIILNGTDLDVYPGECLVIAGSNGSGKTTLMRIIAGLLEADAGTVHYRRENLENILRKNRSIRAEKSFRAELGIVFQDPDAQFVGETVEEDAAFGPSALGMGGEESRRRGREALLKTGLWEKRALPPRRLSGGEKRRLAAAGVLASGCETIILDEPFANLDWPGVVQILSIIKVLKEEEKTLLILTHELEKVLALANRLVILHRGRIQDGGEPGEVLDRLRDEYGIRDPRRNYANTADCSWL